MMGLALLVAFTPADAVREAVAKHESVPAEDVQIDGLGALQGAPDDADWVVRLPEARGLCGSIPVILSTPGHRYAVRAVVTVWLDLAVSETAVSPGERVRVTSSREPCTVLHGETPVDPGLAWEAGVSLAAGSPVTTARVRTWPDVRKGAGVKIEAGVGGLTVTADGQLLQDAFVGKKVAVLNLATRAVLSGTYLSDGVVRVEGP